LTEKKQVVEEPPKVSMAREKVLEEARRALEAEEGRKGISIVVIGNVLLLVLYVIIN
jgi:elongation factor 1 alpha-like protein